MIYIELNFGINILIKYHNYILESERKPTKLR